ncbi:hypothetical protein [Microvirgula aerodenitrificans]|uniref:hypothetical protein n=1 Tax=Microvirgula aerodenitrificans TaxID=57480 RepID=UPI002F3EBAF7
MMKRLPDWLIACVCRALIGEIYSSIRAIAISFEDNKNLTIRYYLDREVNDLDWENLEVVATNISSAMGVEQIPHIDLDCKFDPNALGKLDCLDGFIYARDECTPE